MDILAGAFQLGHFVKVFFSLTADRTTEDL